MNQKREVLLKKQRVNYYADELNDEFSTARIKAKRIDGHYAYASYSLGGRLAHFFWYRIVAMPIAWFYTKCKFRHRIVGEDRLHSYRRKGYFLYGNHTQDIGDAFIPNMLQKCQDKYFIVHPSNVSIPLIGALTPHLGAIPLPDDRAAYRNFRCALEKRLNAGAAIVIYPEAHIWPYYTKIRPFGDDAFYYPVKYDVPVFCFTNTYQRQGLRRTPQIVTYVDGPFFPDKCLPAHLRRKALRDLVHATMTERAKKSNMIVIKYIKKEE